MARVDVQLESLLIKKAMYDLHPEEAAYWVDPEMIVTVGIDFTGDINELKGIGFEVHSTSGTISFGRIRFSNLEQLVKHPDLVSIDKQRVDRLTLHDSIPDILANTVWQLNGDTFKGYTGRDVIIGIIDSGIDFRHRNFRKPDGSTRISKIWDQTIINPIKPPAIGEVAPLPIAAPAPASLHTPLGYGVEYLRKQITDTINDDTILQPCRHEDVDGHGTHVAGIAAGNGKQAGGCHGEHYYIGVAPEADLIIVRLWGLSKGDKGENMKPPANPKVTAPSPNTFLDAVKYIINSARTAGKAAVINCSFGLFSEFMDGTHPQSQAIDALLNANSTGNAIVFAAGNDGNAGFHAVTTIGASGSVFDLEFVIYRDDSEERSFAITYTGSNLEVQVISPVGGANGTVAWVPLNNAASAGTSNTANGTITGGTAGSVAVTNRANKIGITITPPKTGATPPVNGSNVPNTETARWKIQIRNTIATPTPIHAFCLYGSSHDTKSPKFLNNTTTDTTFTQLATSAEVITVGSYEVGGQLAASSGRGPALYPAASVVPQKPDICAPGVNIQSTAIPKNRDDGDDTCANCCCECCQDWYVGKGGTSMAAPHVTGVIALILHRNNTLTHTDIKTLLRANNGGKPTGVPPADLPGWGPGKVNSFKTVNAATQVNPPVAFVALPQEAQPSLLEQFLGTAFGAQYYRLGQKYFREILHLINTNKRVATIWHRIKGPVWTRMAITAAHNPEAAIPLSAHNMPFKDSFEQFVRIVKQFASTELLKDLEGFESYVNLFQQEMKMRDMILLLGNQPLPQRKEASHY